MSLISSLSFYSWPSLGIGQETLTCHHSSTSSQLWNLPVASAWPRCFFPLYHWVLRSPRDGEGCWPGWFLLCFLATVSLCIKPLEPNIWLFPYQHHMLELSLGVPVHRNPQNYDSIQVLLGTDRCLQDLYYGGIHYYLFHPPNHSKDGEQKNCELMMLSTWVFRLWE